MSDKSLLDGKRILIVDDEPDIVESIEEVLSMCRTESAFDYGSAAALLNEEDYDAAILDIMGVRGYDLLEIARDRDIPALMLTAHALSPENFAKSVKEGAHCYIPKDQLVDMDTFLLDVLESGPESRGVLGRWFSRLQPIFDRKFGDGWLEKYKDYWE